MEKVMSTKAAPAVALREDNLDFDALIKSGGNVSWHGQELMLAAIDIEELVTKRLEDILK